MLEDYVRRLQGRLSVDRVLLFGSRARGDGLHQSDVDLAVISPDFRGMPWPRRLELLWGLWDYDVPGECFGYTPEEFDARKGELGFVGEIHRHGIPIPTGA